jgi:fumarylacetoacetate (FAA) hydrolase
LERNVKLARVRHDGQEFIAAVEDQTVTLVMTGGQAALVEIAMRRATPAPLAAPIPLEAVTFLTPVPQPPAFRDYLAFEAHLRNSTPGGKVDEGWYEHPLFYFSNPHVMKGPDEDIPIPIGTRCLDYELEVAAVIGREASDLDPRDPSTLDVICGFTILNDWSARDIQANEMKQNLGVVKGKDFASSLGPVLVTPDELRGFASGRPEAVMTARVNGEEWSRGRLSDIHFSWAELVAYASRNSRLLPGDVIGSGTVGTGCILELRQQGLRDTRKWLRDGDVVELEVSNIGVLRNRVVAKPT